MNLNFTAGRESMHGRDRTVRHHNDRDVASASSRKRGSSRSTGMVFLEEVMSGSRRGETLRTLAIAFVLPAWMLNRLYVAERATARRSRR